MPTNRNDELPLKIEDLRPPIWLPEAHATADLGTFSSFTSHLERTRRLTDHRNLIGYIGYHPPRPDREEDILTETAVKNGLVLSPSVAVS